MRRVVINGKFISDRMQGIVRYARELTSALDDICGDLDVILLLPPDTKDDIGLKNIKCINYGKHKGIKWEQIDLARYMRANKDAMCLNLCNVAPVFAQPGITVVHDIMYKVLPDNYTTFRNRISRLWHMIQYMYVINREIRIVTVSEFSKHDIEENYPKAKERISVIPNAWQHVLRYTENTGWQDAYPFLQDKNFYFSLSTLSKNKNGKWIIEVARRNPDSTFAIAGKYYETDDYSIPSNVYMLGFVSDEDACALMKHCKAFIHPSLYEGFGIPPLEALALGAEVISSNATALPEVLGNSAHYIDPYDYNVNIDSILSEDVEPREKALSKYDWKKSAQLMLTELRELCGGVLYRFDLKYSSADITRCYQRRSYCEISDRRAA